MGWAGIVCVGLGCAGLDWAGLDCARLGWAVLGLDGALQGYDRLIYLDVPAVWLHSIVHCKHCDHAIADICIAIYSMQQPVAHRPAVAPDGSRVPAELAPP